MNIFKKNKILIFILISTFLFSCVSNVDIVKRHYRNGYYISFHQTKKNNFDSINSKKIESQNLVASNSNDLIISSVDDNTKSLDNKNVKENIEKSVVSPQKNIQNKKSNNLQSIFRKHSKEVRVYKRKQLEQKEKNNILDYIDFNKWYVQFLFVFFAAAIYILINNPFTPFDQLILYAFIIAVVLCLVFAILNEMVKNLSFG